MTLKGKHIVGIGDLTRAEIELIFRAADRFHDRPQSQPYPARDYQLATFFFEPSTRTRLSFESAMHRLGGSVLSVADAAHSSAIKGESLADTVRVVSAYADVLVLRHPAEGAARLAADLCGIPVINAGDGAREHPTQTLCDLYTLRQEFGKIEGLTVALYGDLKYGRTVHSLARGLALFGARVVFAPVSAALGPPPALLARLQADYGHVADWWEPGGGSPMPPVDALYLTRIQLERLRHGHEAVDARDITRIDRRVLRQWGVDDRTLLMHPLPRAGELAPELDADPQSAYFRQVAYAVPVRMAILALLLGVAEEEWSSGWGTPRRLHISPWASSPTGFIARGVSCANPACIANREPDAVEPRFSCTGQLEGPALVLCCRYCDAPALAAGVGERATGAYRPGVDPAIPDLVARATTADIVVFANAELARREGFTERTPARCAALDRAEATNAGSAMT